MTYPTITVHEARKIMNAKDGALTVSLDLGKTQSQIAIKGENVTIGEQTFKKAILKKAKESSVYILVNGQLITVDSFSEDTNLVYKLVPTADWPTIKISSTPMHRHIKISPQESAKLMVAQVEPLGGNVLDTCCGLGYTAILASKHAQHVDTFEVDPNVQEIARFNPWSSDLFAAKNITIHQESVLDGISKFPDGHFTRIIHDPPTFKHAPELYDYLFHKELFRVLKKNGILYHYCPNPGKLKGNIFYSRLITQLKELGFSYVDYREEAAGIRAMKEF